MSLGTLAWIGLCGLCGPLLSAGAGGAVPVVVGEISAGVIIGRTAFHAIDTANPTLSFLSDIGFAMLMLSAGMNVPWARGEYSARSAEACVPLPSSASLPSVRGFSYR